MRSMIHLLLVCLAGASPLAAQWSTAIEVTRFASDGHARDPDGTELGPHAPKMIALVVAAEHGGWRVQLAGRYLESGLGVSGTDGAVITPDVITGRGGAVELQRRLAGNGMSPTLRGGLGLEVLRWSFAGASDDSRWRLMPLGNLDLSIGIAGRWRFVVRAEVLTGRSLFTADELPAGYAIRNGIRHGLALGVERRW